jgi:hypothetical protein
MCDQGMSVNIVWRRSMGSYAVPHGSTYPAGSLSTRKSLLLAGTPAHGARCGCECDWSIHVRPRPAQAVAVCGDFHARARHLSDAPHPLIGRSARITGMSGRCSATTRRSEHDSAKRSTTSAWWRGTRGRRCKSCQPDRETASDVRKRSSEAVFVSTPDGQDGALLGSALTVTGGTGAVCATLSTLGPSRVR